MWIVWVTYLLNIGNSLTKFLPKRAGELCVRSEGQHSKTRRADVHNLDRFVVSFSLGYFAGIQQIFIALILFDSRCNSGVDSAGASSWNFTATDKAASADPVFNCIADGSDNGSKAKRIDADRSYHAIAVRKSDLRNGL